MPELRYEFMEQNPGGIVYIKNIPRFTRIEFEFWADEMDSGSDDYLDFDPAPNTVGGLSMTVLVNEMKAQTMVGKRAGEWDVDLNRAKRIVSDGKNNWPGDKVRAFIEFVVNLHVDEKETDYSEHLKSIGKMVTIVGNKISHEPYCRDYAKQAVSMTGEAQKIGCGFAPPVWSSDEQMHYNWCMHGGNAAQAGKENLNRATALNDCAIEKAAAVKPSLGICAIYADEAIKLAAAAKALGCGVSGPRWSTDYNAHLNWCTGGVNQGALLSEGMARAAEYDACLKSKSP